MFDLTRNESGRIYIAARNLAKRILPDSPAVLQFARLIRCVQPIIEDTEAMVDNINRAHAPLPGTDVFTDAFARQMALNALGREVVQLETPPQITAAMLPKRRETDTDDENIKGLAELVADLGIAYALEGAE